MKSAKRDIIGTTYCYFMWIGMSIVLGHAIITAIIEGVLLSSIFVAVKTVFMMFFIVIYFIWPAILFFVLVWLISKIFGLRFF